MSYYFPYITGFNPRLKSRVRAAPHNHIGDDNWFNTTTGQLTYLAFASGGIAQLDPTSEAALGSLAVNHPGLCRIDCGSSFAAICRMTGTGGLGYAQLPQGGFVFTSVYLLTTLSVAGQQFTVRQGIGVVPNANAVPALGIYFLYTHTTNGGAWTPVIRRGGAGSESLVPSVSVPVAANTWYKLGITALPNYQSVMFYVNDVLIATLATGATMPQTGDLYGWFAQTTAQSGVTSRNTWLDVMDFQPNFGIGR